MSTSRFAALVLGCSVLAGHVGAAAAQDLPPPPTYTPPAQPYSPPPPPEYAPPPVYQPQPQPAYQPTYQPAYQPRWRPQFGLGIRGMGAYSGNALTGFGQGGVGGDLFLRVHPRVTMELGVQYQRTTDQSTYTNGYDRMDVPITLGLRVHLGNPFWHVSPYLALAAGVSYAEAAVWTTVGPVYDAAWMGEGQVGGGLEFRLGRHVNLWMDLRAATRLRSQSPQQVTVLDDLDRSYAVIGNQFGGQFNIGMGVFF